MTWYEEFIEPEIRDIVKLLRDNGFNAESSCGHEMYVEYSYLMDGTIQRLHNLLFNSGYRNYVISLECRIIEGHQYRSLEVRFDKGELR